MARSSSALYSAYAYTYHVHIDSVLAAFFPRKSQSKPQTNTSIPPLNESVKCRQITNVLHHSCFPWPFQRFFLQCAKSSSISQYPGPYYHCKC